METGRRRSQGRRRQSPSTPVGASLISLLDYWKAYFILNWYKNIWSSGGEPRNERAASAAKSRQEVGGSEWRRDGGGAREGDDRVLRLP